MLKYFILNHSIRSRSSQFLHRFSNPSYKFSNLQQGNLNVEEPKAQTINSDAQKNQQKQQSTSSTYLSTLAKSFKPRSRLEIALATVSLCLGSLLFYNGMQIRKEQKIIEYLNEGQTDKAAELLEKKLKKDFQLRYAAKLYQCYRELKKYNEAEALLFDMLKKLPQETIATKFQLAHMYIQQERLFDAALQLGDVIQLTNDFSSLMKLKASNLIKARTQNSSLETPQQKIKAYALLSRLYFILTQEEETEFLAKAAVKIFTETNNTDPNQTYEGIIEAKLVLGASYFAKDKLKESQAELESALGYIQKDGDEVVLREIVSTLVQVYAEEKEYNKAIKLCLNSKIQDKFKADCLLKVGRINWKQEANSLDLQEKIARDAIKLGGKSIDSFVFLVNVLLKKKKHSEALKLSEEMLAGDKNNVDLIMVQAEIKSKMGKNHEAIKLLQNAGEKINQNQDSNQIHKKRVILIQLGQLLVATGNKEKAIEVLEQALEVSHQDRQLLSQLIQLYSEKDDKYSETRQQQLQIQLSRLVPQLQQPY